MFTYITRYQFKIPRVDSKSETYKGSISVLLANVVIPIGSGDAEVELTEDFWMTTWLSLRDEGYVIELPPKPKKFQKGWFPLVKDDIAKYAAWLVRTDCLGSNQWFDAEKLAALKIKAAVKAAKVKT